MKNEGSLHIIDQKSKFFQRDAHDPTRGAGETHCLNGVEDEEDEDDPRRGGGQRVQCAQQ